MFYNFKVLKEIDFKVDFFKEYDLKMVVKDNKISGFINNKLMIEVEDNNNILESGGSGFTVADGTLVSDEIKIN